MCGAFYMCGEHGIRLQNKYQSIHAESLLSQKDISSNIKPATNKG
jgi:hypothetical protein